MNILYFILSTNDTSNYEMESEYISSEAAICRLSKLTLCPHLHSLAPQQMREQI